MYIHLTYIKSCVNLSSKWKDYSGANNFKVTHFSNSKFGIVVIHFEKKQNIAYSNSTWQQINCI